MTGNLDKIVNELGSRYYKVGSVVITSTNTNPSSIYGGTWELVRKRFKQAYITDAYEFNTTNTTGGVSVVHIAKDSIIVRIGYYPKVAFADSALTIATLDPTKIGLTSSDHIYTTREIAIADGLNAMDLISVKANVSSAEIITKTTATSVAASTSYRFYSTFALMYNATPTSMIDSFCDEFWWVRTA